MMRALLFMGLAIYGYGHLCCSLFVGFAVCGLALLGLAVHVTCPSWASHSFGTVDRLARLFVWMAFCIALPH